MVESVVQSHAEIVVGSAEKKLIRVLHVDDELGLLKVAKQCLELQGPFQVDTAGSVEEALNKLKEKEYDAVISDYQMPGKDGLEFLEMLRKSGNTIPFMMFTGKGREGVAVKAWSLGADHYVNKTGDPETVYCELAHNIRQAVEKKTALEMRNVCQQRFLCLVENAAAGVGIFDPQGRFTYVNDALANLLGYPARELAGRHFGDFLHKEDKARILESFRQFSELETESSTLEFRAVRKDGRLAYLMAKPTKSEIDGKIVGSQAIIVDITERKKMEQDLVDNQERLLRIFSASPDAIILSDINGNIVECNQATLDMLELSSKEELIGKSGSEFTPEKDHQRVKENLRRALEQGSVKNVEYTFLTKSGREIPTELSSSALKDSAGKIVGFVSVAKDITERKKAEEELSRSEEKYKGLFENARDVIVLFDLKGNVTSINKAAEEYGFNKSEMLGKNMLKFVSKRYWPKLLSDVAQIALGKTAKGRIEIHTPKGDKMAEHGSNPIFSENRVVGIQTILEDITERKKSDQTLKESEGKYRGLVELAPDGIVAVNAEGIVTSANRSFLTLVGYNSEEEIVGKPFTELKSSRVEDIPKFQGMFMSLMKGESPSPVEFLYVRRDGTSRWAEVHPGLLIKDGHPVGVQAIMRDVSERKNAEKLVQESHQKFEGLFRHNPEAAVYLDVSFKIVDVNPRFCQLFGYSAEEVKGKNTNDLVVPEDMREEAESLDKDAKNGYASHNTVRKRKDGSLVPVSISAAPVAFDDNLLGYVGIYKDITDLKKLEEKLRVAGSLTRHDVRNKLSAVTGNAYLLRRTLAGNPEALEQLADMENAVRNAEAIFEFAGTYEKLGVEQLTSMDVGKAVDEAASLFTDLKGVKIVNECEGLTVLADSLLRQLFYNLIDNSLKYGKKLSQIRIHYEKAEGNQLRLVYEDDGVGIAWDAKPKIFDEGFTTGKGSGYGLYLVKRMMDVYGWTISETGTPGKGVHFTMVMPEKNQNGKENYQLH